MKKWLYRFFQKFKKWEIESGELNNEKNPHLELILLLVRNILVLISAALFILGLFRIPHRFLLKGIAYLLGSGAYLCEILILTDCFTKKIQISEKIMAYCFGGLYVLMSISYFAEHLQH